MLAPLTVAEAVARLSAKSRLRRLLPRLCHANPATRDAAYRALERLAPTGSSSYVATWAISATEACERIEVATRVAFPPLDSTLSDTAHDMVFPIIQSPHRAVVPVIERCYASAADRLRCAMLAVLGAVGSRPAARAFVTCVRSHGWPVYCYARVFSELAKLAHHGAVLFPDLLVTAGKHIGDVTDALVEAIEDRKLAIADLDIAPLAPLVTRELAAVLPKVRKAYARNRYSERYQSLRRGCGTWLDLAGYLAAPIDALLATASKLRDPRLAMLAALASLRRGRRVAARVIERAAASDETRADLWRGLAALGSRALAKFPRRYRTWDAFAAAEMVRWLAHPNELGRAPDELEQMAVLTRRGKALYVYRFRADSRTWYAAICGPFARRGAPAPVYGPATFSQFEAWTKRTAEGHAAAILATLSRAS